MNLPPSTTHTTEFVIVSDTVTNATNIFSLVTKKSGLFDTMGTRFLCDLVLNQKSNVKTNISSYFASYLQIYTDFCPPYFQTIKLWWIVPYYELCHLHCTNWQLKCCTWRLYFSSWWPQTWGFFLILSPVPTCRLYQVTPSLTGVQDIKVLG